MHTMGNATRSADADGGQELATSTQPILAELQGYGTHSTTGAASAELFGRPIRTKLPEPAPTPHTVRRMMQLVHVMHAPGTNSDRKAHARPSLVQAGDDILVSSGKRTNSAPCNFAPWPQRVVRNKALWSSWKVHANVNRCMGRNTTHVRRLPTGGKAHSGGVCQDSDPDDDDDDDDQGIQVDVISQTHNLFRQKASICPLH